MKMCNVHLMKFDVELGDMEQSIFNLKPKAYDQLQSYLDNLVKEGLAMDMSDDEQGERTNGDRDETDQAEGENSSG